MTERVATEAQEQTALIQWARMMSSVVPELRLLHHIPNGGSRNRAEAARLRAQGVLPGVPDLFLPAARNGAHGLYIELKRTKGGRVSVEQGLMLAALREQGYRAEVCHGWIEARAVIEDYLKPPATAAR